MSIRTKLSRLAGMESMTRDETTDDLHQTIVENVFTNDTGEELTPPEDLEEQKINEAIAEATSDIKESNKITKLYLKQKQEQEEAVMDLHEAVDGLEQLLMTDYSHESLSVLARHTERCAQRAGLSFKFGVTGMESLTPASVYLSVRSGLESLSEVQQNSADSIKVGYDRLISSCADVEKRYDLLLKNLRLLMDRLKKNPEIKSDISLGKWNQWLNVQSNPPKPIVKLVNLMEIEYILDRIKVLDIISNDDLVSAKAQEQLSKDIKKSIDVSRDRTEDGKNHNAWEFRFNTACFYFDLPNQNGTSLEALKVFNLRMQPFSDRYADKSKNVYRSADQMISELEEMISIVEDTKTTYTDWKKTLKTQRDLVVSAFNAEKVDSGKALGYVSLLNRFMTTSQRGIYEITSAYERLFRAHIA